MLGQMTCLIIMNTEFLFFFFSFLLKMIFLLAFSLLNWNFTLLVFNCSCPDFHAKVRQLWFVFIQSQLQQYWSFKAFNNVSQLLKSLCRLTHHLWWRYTVQCFVQQNRAMCTQLAEICTRRSAFFQLYMLINNMQSGR